MISKTKIGGVILAGGQASRMNYNDKALQPMLGKPLLEYVIAKAAPQLDRLVLSVNHNSDSYQQFGLPLIADLDRSYAGPLLGILSAMRWYKNDQASREISHLACFPADVPEFPLDIVSQLAQAMGGEMASVAYINHEAQIQPLFSLWHLELIEEVENAIREGLFGPKLLFPSLPAIAVDCEARSPAVFCNINTPEDLRHVERLLERK